MAGLLWRLFRRARVTDQWQSDDRYQPDTI